MDLFTLNTIEIEEITDAESEELNQHERTIERGLHTFVEVGQALLAIRDKRLYREIYNTFEDYCRERWGMQRAYAYRLMGAAEVVANLLPIGDKLPVTETQARPLTSLVPEQQVEAWKLAIERSEGKPTAAIVQQVVNELRNGIVTCEACGNLYDGVKFDMGCPYCLRGNKPRLEVVHVSDDSYEWYTPPEYIEAARGLMGGIDLDPASCANAQMIVQAGEYYTKEQDGLSQDWQGRVWLNPPYCMPEVEKFTGRVIDEYQNGNVKAAVILVNNCTDTGWFHRLLDYPVCFTRGRIQFWTTEGPNLGARQGQAIFYLGDKPDLFARLFSNFGVVLKRA